MLDLPGAQLIIQLEYDQTVTLLPNLRSPNVSHLERINLPHSISVRLGIGDRREWHLPKFRLYKGSKGTTNFVYSFPKTYEEILAETK